LPLKKKNVYEKARKKDAKIPVFLENDSFPMYTTKSIKKQIARALIPHTYLGIILLFQYYKQHYQNI